MVAFTQGNIQALSSGNQFGPTKRLMNYNSGGIGGVLAPKALVVGANTLMTAVDVNGIEITLSVDTANAQFLEMVETASQPGFADNHNAAAQLTTADGKLFQFWTQHDGANTKVFYKRADDANALTTATLKTVTTAVGGQPAYAQAFIQESTGNIYCFCRNQQSDWEMFTSTDNGVTLTYTGIVIYNDIDPGVKTLYGLLWVDADTLRFFGGIEPQYGNAQLRVFDLNVATLDIQGQGGSIGTVNSSPAVYSNCGIIWDPPYGFGFNSSAAFSITQLFGTYVTADASAPTVPYFVYCNDEAHVFDGPSYWTKVQIDWGDSFEWFGHGLCFVPGTTTPEIIRCCYDATGDVSYIQKYTSTDAVGTSWTHTTLLSGGSSTSQFWYPIVANNADTAGYVIFYLNGPEFLYNSYTTKCGWIVSSSS